jgi:uncharacterized membrane protein YjjP (DUF1212 family)
MAEEKQAQLEKQDHLAVQVARGILRLETNSTLLRAIRESREGRWFIPLAFLAVCWIFGVLSSRFALKAYFILAILFGLAIYFEVQALRANDGDDQSHPLQDEQEK